MQPLVVSEAHGCDPWPALSSAQTINLARQGSSAIAIRDDLSRALVVPHHRADPPSGRSHDELRRDHPQRLSGYAVRHTSLLVAAEPTGDFAEHLGDVGRSASKNSVSCPESTIAWRGRMKPSRFDTSGMSEMFLTRIPSSVNRVQIAS